jgi:pimeloyl-ACP methyl ester carboxylesterase
MNDSRHWARSLRVSDLRGLADVAVHGTRDVTAVVEGVHGSIQATLGLSGGAPPGRTRGIPALVYRSIDGITSLTGAGIGASLALTERLVPEPASSRERDVVLGILNGVFGDRLEETNNPLALPMRLHYRGQAVGTGGANSWSGAGGRILVMIHGLCMTEHGWSRRGNTPSTDLGAALAAQRGLTPVYLRYNSGRAVAANGLELAGQMEALLADWPVPVEQLTLLGHSMGGLLARSAVAHGQLLDHAWIRRLDQMIFLGTPHQGAPLERAGALLDTVLHGIPYTRPFTALTGRRSRGIRDLRDGEMGTAARDSANVGDEVHHAEAVRRLPESVKVLAVAGTRSTRPANRRVRSTAHGLAGDGLVPVDSALGRHPDRERDLGLPESSRLVLFGHHHMDLLDSEEVVRSVSAWLSERQRSAVVV